MRYLIAALLFGSTAFGQDATVIFYSVGSMRKALLKAEVTVGIHSEPPFTGFLFDGEKRLGLLQPGHFMTLHLPIGPHTFSPASATSVKRPSQKVQLPLTLESGKQYVIRLTQTNKGFYVVQVPFQHIPKVDCEAARDEASGAEPIQAKKGDKHVRDSLEFSPYFLRCK